MVVPPAPPPVKVDVPVLCRIDPPVKGMTPEDWPAPNADGSTTLPIAISRKLRADLIAERQFQESYRASCYQAPE